MNGQAFEIKGPKSIGRKIRALKQADWEDTVVGSQEIADDAGQLQTGQPQDDIRVVHRTCPLCDRDNSDEPPTRFSQGRWEVKICAGCDFVYIEEAPEYEELFERMSWERTYQQELVRRAEIRPVSHRYSRMTRWRMGLVPRKKMHLMVQTYAQPGNVVDLGCGTGGHLTPLSPDFVPYGVEISVEAAKAADEAFSARGGRVINAPSLEGLKAYPENFFTAATLRSYLEHEMNPMPVLLELRRSLVAGGVAIIKVPNFASLNRRFAGPKWCGFRYPDHLNYFTPSSLRDMASRCGFDTRYGLTFKLPTSDNMYAVLTKRA